MAISFYLGGLMTADDDSIRRQVTRFTDFDDELSCSECIVYTAPNAREIPSNLCLCKASYI